MKIRFPLALVGLAISLALPSFAQQKATADPRIAQMHSRSSVSARPDNRLNSISG
jgi:hypothetical protein